jgi:hypothetical protein
MSKTKKLHIQQLQNNLQKNVKNDFVDKRLFYDVLTTLSWRWSNERFTLGGLLIVDA